MPKRSSKKDLNQNAFSIVRAVTTAQPELRVIPTEKNAAAVALGRLGGLKGGKARAAKLSKKRRSEIAQSAASMRWSKNLPEPD